MSPLSPCGAFMNDRFNREKCMPCNGKGCKCCQNLGRHYLPGTHINQGGSSKAMGRIIRASIAKDAA